MITEEQFTTAMRAAVAERGGDWTYPKFNAESREGGWYGAGGVPTYSNQHGAATCLIGKAMELAGLAVPFLTSGGSALAALDQKVPLNVIYAARVAQIHQDGSRPWAEALALYEHAAKVATPGRGYALYIDSCEALGIKPIESVTAYSAASGPITFTVQSDKVQESLMKMMAGIDEATKALGSVKDVLQEEPTVSFPPVVVSKSGVTVNGTLNPTYGSLISTYATGGVLYVPEMVQKDHALVA